MPDASASHYRSFLFSKTNQALHAQTSLSGPHGGLTAVPAPAPPPAPPERSRPTLHVVAHPAMQLHVRLVGEGTSA